MRLPLLLGLLMLFSIPAQAGEAVTYYDGDTELEGYWAQSACEDTEEPAPVVLIIHQWKGLGDYEKRRADMLSERCYHAFAIDMYGKGVRPQTREDAAAQSSKYKSDPALARGRASAALDYATERTGIGSRRIAAMGYCFGGTMALELARSGADIAGVTSFHGGLSTQKPARPGDLKASVQVHHGAADPHVPPEELHGFMDEMDGADADWYVIQYADAVHAFTEKEAGDDPSTGAAYNRKADIRSWAGTLAFLNEIFAGNPLDKSGENTP